MTKVKIELNSSGIQALLKSSEIISALKEPAESIRVTLGDKFETDTHIGKTRANVSVFTTDPEAMEMNMENNAMIKAVGEYFRTNKDGSKKFVKAPPKRKKA